MRLLSLACLWSMSALAQNDPCAKERQETAAWVSQLAGEVDRGSVMLAPTQHLAPLAGTPLQLGVGRVSLTVTATATSISGRLVSPESKAELDKQLLAAEALQEDLHSGLKPKWKQEYLVIVDADVTWERVARIVNAAAKAGPRRFTFVFADPVVGASAPSQTSIDAALAEIRSTPDFSEKTTKLSALSKKVFTACAEVASAFGEPRESSDFGPFLLKISKRVPSCTCRLDFPAFRALLWMTFHTDAQTMVELDVGATGRAIAAKGTDAWGDASAQLVAAAAGKGPVKLAVSGKK